jgi:hypothetical protein
MKKRRSLRSTFDGCYKFTRYFAPGERNRSTTIEELYKWNNRQVIRSESDRELRERW